MRRKSRGDFRPDGHMMAIIVKIYHSAGTAEVLDLSERGRRQIEFRFVHHLSLSLLLRAAVRKFISL